MKSTKWQLVSLVLGRNFCVLATVLFLGALGNASQVSATIQAGVEYDVYFLTGQSNGAGRGDVAELPSISGGIYAAPQTDVLFYYRSTLTDSSGNINTTLTPDVFTSLQSGSGHGFNNPGSHAAGEFGPELSLGRTLADAFPQKNIMIIKYAHGGSNLHTQWAAGGIRYNDFLSVVNDSLAEITNQGATYQLKGLAWVQGESDVNSQPNAYEANLTSFINRVRTDVFAGEEAAITISRLSVNQYNSVSANLTTVRNAQVAVADAINNVEWLDADGANFSTYNISNPIHFDAQGNISQGIAMGNQFAILNAEPLLGDVNLDGAVDFLDISPFVSILTLSGFQLEADIDESSAVDFLDIGPFITLLSAN